VARNGVKVVEEIHTSEDESYFWKGCLSESSAFNIQWCTSYNCARIVMLSSPSRKSITCIVFFPGCMHAFVTMYMKFSKIFENVRGDFLHPPILHSIFFSFYLRMTIILLN